MASGRAECSYGKSCYRRNPDHFLEYKHTHIEERLSNPSNRENFSSLQQSQAKIVEKLISDGKIKVQKGEAPISADGLDVAVTGSSSSKEEKNADSSPQEPSPKRMKKDVEQDAAASASNSTAATATARNQVELKKLKASSSSLLASSGFDTVLKKWEAAAPFHLFLSKIDGVPETHNEPLTLTFSDILDPSLGAVQESMQINYMCDPGWLLAQYCVHKLQRTPITIFYGSENPDVEAIASKVPTLSVVRMKPKYLFGHHHTKMSILYYDDCSMRVIVHTGNLYDSDWEDRTQGMWISPRCPVKDGPSDSPTHFRKDLIDYLNTYEQPRLLTKWIERLRKVDMSDIRVALVASAPGNHMDKSFGHPRLTTLLRLHTPEMVKSDEWQIVAQCSSIGSLGPQPTAWFQGEFATALGTTGNQGPKLGVGAGNSVELIYPSFNDVQSSLHGLLGGGCLPYSKKTHGTQSWLTDYLNHWKCDCRFRTRAMPHIKSYTRLSKDGSKALWFLLSSANVSKAAWGMRNKAGNLTIQAWEAGVLFLPKFFNLGNHFVCNYSGVNISDELPLHYDFPLKKYEGGEQPFFIDCLR